MNILPISSFLEALNAKGIDNMFEKWYKKVELHYPLLPIASLVQIKMFSEFDMWIIPINEWLDHELIKFIKQTQYNLNENQWETVYEREQQLTKESVTYIVHKQF